MCFFRVWYVQKSVAAGPHWEVQLSPDPIADLGETPGKTCGEDRGSGGGKRKGVSSIVQSQARQYTPVRNTMKLKT